MNIKDIYEQLKDIDLCVFSTVSDNKPQSSLMGFGVTEELELIFGTSNKSRKFSNIKSNLNVSVVFSLKNHKTVQYEGTAELLNDEDLEKYKNIYFDLRPSVRKYESLPDQVYFKVKPIWIRYTDVSKKPWDIFEINFDTISKIK